MNTITRESIKVILAKKMSANDGERIEFTKEALEQLEAVRKIVVKKTGFDESKLGIVEMTATNIYAEMFSSSNITGEVVDGKLLPLEDDLFQSVLKETEEVSSDYDQSIVLSIVLIEEVCRELGYFYR